MRLQVLDVDMGYVYGDPIHLSSDEFEVLDACPICANTDAQRSLAVAVGNDGPGVAVALCSVCGHTYLDRRPSVAWFAEYYAEDWDTGQTGSASGEARLRRTLRKAPLARRSASAARAFKRGTILNPQPRPARLLSMLAGIKGASSVDDLPQGARVLEIGCGYGGSLALLRDVGFVVTGTEANEHRARSARSLGLDVEITGVDDFDPVADKGPFDIVYSSHVFEHLTDLHLILEKLVPLIAPDGSIYIEVPYAPVAENLIHRTHVPVHCHLFTVSSLVRLLEAHGFYPLRILADMSIHVVASRGTPREDRPILSDAGSPDQMARGLQQLASRQGRFSLRHDHYYCTIRAASGGETVYERQTAHAIAPLPRDRWSSFDLEVESGDDDLWPMLFVHDAQSAPFWVKRQ